MMPPSCISKHQLFGVSWAGHILQWCVEHIAIAPVLLSAPVGIAEIGGDVERGDVESGGQTINILCPHADPYACGYTDIQV